MHDESILDDLLDSNQSSVTMHATETENESVYVAPKTPHTINRLVDTHNQCTVGGSIRLTHAKMCVCVYVNKVWLHDHVTMWCEMQRQVFASI